MVWAVVISAASTSAFKGANTANYIIPILHWLLPKAEVWTLWEIHYRIRKAAHVFEYSDYSQCCLCADSAQGEKNGDGAGWQRR